MVVARKQQEIQPFVFKVFVALVVATWLLDFLITGWFIAQQLPGNPNLSAFYTTLLYQVLLPLLLFGGFMGYRRRKTGLALVTESVVLAFSVWLAVVTMSRVVQFVLNQFQVVLAGDLGWWYLELTVCAVSTLAALAVVIYARRLGKW